MGEPDVSGSEKINSVQPSTSCISLSLHGVFPGPPTQGSGWSSLQQAEQNIPKELTFAFCKEASSCSSICYNSDFFFFLNCAAV